MKSRWFALLWWMVAAGALTAAQPERGPLLFNSVPEARFQFTGMVGDRVEANVQNWLLCAPQANPGMLEMFRLRDRQPSPQIVPWAGEFIGKYLIAAVQALRMTEDPRLLTQVSNVVAAFIATQADDGYLGPFAKETRLLKNWDLWGHYHALEALALWNQHAGDRAALEAARKAADLVCRTYLETGRRVLDAGDPEMNMSILTGMAMMYRLTGEPRYLQMAREVEKDWERAGDYLRAGLDGREYFQSPRPRWESLHDLQGLVELWRITGETKYRDAFIHHWRSIRRWDRRNTGAFSSGEQATGNPYAPTAIETCCTVAWMTLTADYLRLTGDPLAADDLELATCNGGLGAQHPSGRWWTYNTPMDGIREASAHTIVFQARAGTPELNCCSVNGPRVPGLLSEWAVMSAPEGLVINSYLPVSCALCVAGQAVRLELDRDYPRTNSQRVRVSTDGDRDWILRLRIPAWSANTLVRANFEGVPSRPVAGHFLEIRRQWKTGDEVVLEFDFGMRAVAGANEATGKVSLYRGPVLLAYDQAYNSFDEANLPPLNLARLGEAKSVSPLAGADGLQSKPWLLLDLPVDAGGLLRLVDFASAGANGTRYRSWLPAVVPLPPPAFTQYPRDGDSVRPGRVRFEWREPRGATNITCRLELAADPGFSKILLQTNCPARRRLGLDLGGFANSSGPDRWWRAVTCGPGGETAPDVPPARFKLSPDAPAQVLPPEPKLGPNGELILDALRGEQPPSFGTRPVAKTTARTEQGTQVNGRDQMLLYSVPAWPEEDFTAVVSVRIDELPNGRIGQVFSAWAAGMDDPLRLVVDNGKLFARIEAGSSFGTPGVPVGPSRWHRVAAAKRGATLTLFMDGLAVGSSAAPEFTTTTARDCALGGNPHFTGNEFLAATFADFSLWGRALSDEELRRLTSARDTANRNDRNP